MTRLVAPIGCACISFQGIQVNVVNGQAEVPPEAVEVFKEAFGFAEPGEQDDPHFEPTGDVDKLSRSELFASLKALGVSVPLPKTNAELRDLLAEALAAKSSPAIAEAEAPPEQPAETPEV